VDKASGMKNMAAVVPGERVLKVNKQRKAIKKKSKIFFVEFLISILSV
jgi:hypothetical protein